MPRAIAASEVQGRNTVALARWLLGKLLVVAGPPGSTPRRLRICETEAYHGPADRASHARRGRTPRAAVMFAPGGVWYVYLCYGVHEMLNLVTGPEGWPAAVLIRGIEGVSGPGRLTAAHRLDRRFNGRPADRTAGLWLEDDGWVVPRRAIRATPRIGVASAGPEWAAKPWRFVLTEAPDRRPRLKFSPGRAPGRPRGAQAGPARAWRSPDGSR